MHDFNTTILKGIQELPPEQLKNMLLSIAMDNLEMSGFCGHFNNPVSESAQTIDRELASMILTGHALHRLMRIDIRNLEKVYSKLRTDIFDYSDAKGYKSIWIPCID